MLEHGRSWISRKRPYEQPLDREVMVVQQQQKEKQNQQENYFEPIGTFSLDFGGSAGKRTCSGSSEFSMIMVNLGIWAVCDQKARFRLNYTLVLSVKHVDFHLFVC